MANRYDPVFDVEPRRLALMILPPAWRTPRIGALAFAAVGLQRKLLGQLRKFRHEQAIRLASNGQVCNLRRRLNDELDPIRREIAIVDPEQSDTPSETLYRRREGKWIILSSGKTRIHCRGFAGTGCVDFHVVLPMRLKQCEAQACALVNSLKLVSKRYAIKYKKPLNRI